MKTAPYHHLALAFFALISLAHEARAENPAWFVKLYEQASAVVAKSYPAAQLKLAEGVFYLEKNADQPSAQAPEKSETLAKERRSRERRPRARGIVGRVELRKGKYSGKDILPHREEQNGIVSFRSAPYDEKCDCHLMVHLYTPRGEDDGFAEEFQILVNNFGAGIDENSAVENSSGNN